MTERLLDRQTELLKYLTSGAAIFETETDTSTRGANFGMDSRLLHLEARFSHEKRMAKIGWALSRTLDLLGTALGGDVEHDQAALLELIGDRLL